MTDGINGTLSASEETKIHEFNQDMERFVVSAFIDQHSLPLSTDSRLFHEIVRSGHATQVDDVPRFGGKHLTPEEYHAVLEQEQSNSISNYDNSDENACVDSENDKNTSVIEDYTHNTALKDRKQMMVIDVRNPFEYAIGHFVHSSPLTNENDSYSDEIDGENQVKKENIKYKYAFGQRIPDDATWKVKPTKIEKEDEAFGSHKKPK